MFTLNADEIEKQILAKAPKEHKGAIERVVVAGMKLLFSKETHNQLFDSIRPDDEVPLKDELGAGAANLMMVMYRESRQTMPLQAIIPAGSILLARACEFIDKTKMAPIEDADYGEAVYMFTMVMYDKFDPDFRKKIQGKQQPEHRASPEQQQGILAGR